MPFKSRTSNNVSWSRAWPNTRWSLILIIALCLTSCTNPTPRQPNSAPTRMLIVSIDGLRPDLALLAPTPSLRKLCKTGSYTFWAKTIDYPVTLPSHTSMLTGVLPTRHGVWTNSDWSYGDPPRPQVPTIFELAKTAGLTTALVSGKPKFETLAQPNSLDWWYVPETYTGVKDLDLADRAAAIIRSHHPQLMFVHLPGVDAAGHHDGWGSDAQLKAIHTADKALGRILRELQHENLLDQTVILVTADHGGSALSHWRDDDRNTHIPWIITGPGIRKNTDLTQYRDLSIHTCDTFATACYLLKIPLPDDITGKPVRRAIEQEAPPYDVSY
ncbi:MAG: alkaline phosphatase family protein [Bacillota bacterium]